MAKLCLVQPERSCTVSWQETMADEVVAARKELEREARSAWAELVRDLMPWDVVINAATFDGRQLTRGRGKSPGASASPGVGCEISRAQAVKRFRVFFEKARYALGRPVEGMMACEVGPAGGVGHGHGPLSLAGG